MSVLIKGMKMPINCQHCPCADDECRYCKAANEYIPMLGKPKFCPLVEVPTPHGRLIDASDLNFSMTDSIDQGIAEEVVADAPTIIEAEEGEEA